jgi:hypothetical protein
LGSIQRSTKTGRVEEENLAADGVFALFVQVNVLGQSIYVESVLHALAGTLTTL